MEHKYNFVKFDVKQFSSGEYEVKIAERIYGDTAVIHWNWFDESQRDLMLLLMKISAIKRQYSDDIYIIIYAPYLPYARQDRVFEAGQDVAICTLLNSLINFKYTRIETLAMHCANYNNHQVENKIHDLENEDDVYNIALPDYSAKYHYSLEYYNCIKDFLYFNKKRNSDCISLELITDNIAIHEIKTKQPFLICDDICAGGRTFIECAKILHKEYGNDITIELMVYHAFLDHGLDALKESGISKIYIINLDSYEYICKLYPNDLTYFEFKEIKNV